MAGSYISNALIKDLEKFGGKQHTENMVKARVWNTQIHTENKGTLFTKITMPQFKQDRIFNGICSIRPSTGFMPNYHPHKQTGATSLLKQERYEEDAYPKQVSKMWNMPNFPLC